MTEQSSSYEGSESVGDGMLHVVYGLYALSFLFGLASIAGVIIAYLQRGKPLSAMQRSHIDWQIRTFWLGLLMGLAAFLLMVVWPLGMLAFGLIAIWYLFRIIKGWLRLKDGRAIDDPTAFV